MYHVLSIYSYKIKTWQTSQKASFFFSYLKLCFVFETGIQVAPALAVCVFSFSIHGPARRWEIMNNKGERVHKKTTDQTALQVSSNKRFRSAPFGFIFYGVSASSQPNHTLLSQKKELLHITTVIYHYGDKKQSEKRKKFKYTHNLVNCHR